MRVLLCVTFVLSLVICGCNDEKVKTSTDKVTPPQSGVKPGSKSGAPTHD
jgi:hypothetical protein